MAIHWRMTNAVQLGPLVFAADRLLAVSVLLAFTFAVGKIGEWTGRDTTKVSFWAVVAGILSARLAYVASHLDSYSRDWSSTFALWQGGFSAWAGVVGAAAVLLAVLGLNRTSGFSITAIVALGLAWTSGTVLLKAPPQPLSNMPALVALDGKSIERERLAGRPYIVNLWATWCPPCRRELPMLADVAKGSNIPILLVNEGETATQVGNYLNESGIPADAVVLDKSSELPRLTEADALPTTLFINAHGQIVETHLGEISRAALLDRIVQLQKE